MSRPPWLPCVWGWFQLAGAGDTRAITAGVLTHHARGDLSSDVANLTAILTSQTTATVDTSNAAQQALQV